jgi:hypothetical protein
VPLANIREPVADLQGKSHSESLPIANN